MPEPDDVRQLQVQLRLANKHASEADAQLAETTAMLHESMARELHANARAARSHAESGSARAAVAEVRQMWTRWFEHAHDGLTFKEAMSGIAVGLQHVLGIADEEDAANGDGAWHTVWLEGNWRWLTTRMTTGQRETAADAVARFDVRLRADDHDSDSGEPEDLRWWRDDR